MNNPLYRGCVVWNRVKWTRSAADSTKRKQVLNPRAEWIKHQDERLRIVSEDLWERVKARQMARAHTIKEQVSTGQRKRPVGGGKPPRYLLSDVLRCGPCGTGFTMINAERYGCASHKGGGDAACSNSLTVARTLVESRILEAVKKDLGDTELIAEIELMVRKQLKVAKRGPKVNTEGEIKRLGTEIGNLADAIATGLLRLSPALAEKLSAAEDQLARLLVNAARQKAGTVVEVLSVDRIAERCRDLAAQLDRAIPADPEQARIALRDIVGDTIRLHPHESKRYLEADYGLEPLAMLAQGNSSLTMVAGVGFEPTTFGL